MYFNIMQLSLTLFFFVPAAVVRAFVSHAEGWVVEFQSIVLSLFVLYILFYKIKICQLREPIEGIS